MFGLAVCLPGVIFPYIISTDNSENQAALCFLPLNPVSLS
jgi:hypothetical protein